MNYYIKIFVSSMIITGFFASLLLSNEKTNYKKYKCEKFCKEKYESCSLKASMKKSKDKDKIAAICESRLFDCRERCGKIE